MIFNEKVLKKLMKTAYQGAGLLVANKEGRYILEGGWWRISMSEWVFSKKGKSAVVELIGQIPQAGESFRCTAGGNQMELPEMEDLDEIINELNFNDIYNKTEVMIEHNGVLIRILQNEKRDICCINELIVDLLTGKAEPGEGEYVDGAVLRGDCLYWASDECSLEVGKIDITPNVEEAKNIPKVRLLKNLGADLLPVVK